MPRPSFLPLRVDGRLEAVTRHLADSHDASALIVSSTLNMRYLTGFTGSAGVLICRADDSVLVTDGRYEEPVPKQPYPKSLLLFVPQQCELPLLTRESVLVLAPRIFRR